MTTDRDLAGQALPNYELGDELGRGGWGVVYAAEHRTLQRPVAVKMLPRAFGADPDVRARFLAEARVVASLDHPHIVPLFDFVEHDGLCLLVMEHMPAGTLLDRTGKGLLTPTTACAVSLATLAALSHAHSKGVLHRDIKPENVLFGATGIPKLADFGIAKVVGGATERRTATGVIMGTPAYMAPEQVVGDPVSPATDVYATGVMLYELLSGALPFASTGDPVTQLFRHVHEEPRPLTDARTGLDPTLAAVVHRALAKDPDDRYPDAASFARALDQAAASCLGATWLAASDVTVLATRNELAGGVHTPVAHDPPSRPPEAAPRDRETAAAGRTDPTILETAPVAPPPATSAGPPAGAGDPPHHDGGSSPTSPADPGEPSGTARRPALLLLGSLVALVVVVGAALVVFGGNNRDAESDTSAATASGDAAVTAAEAADFTARCEEFLPPALCACSLEGMLDQFEPETFRANLALMERTQDTPQGTQVLVPVEELLVECVDRTEQGGG